MIHELVESVELSILTGSVAPTHDSRNYTVLTTIRLVAGTML